MATYFDLTDVIYYSEANSRVTGIQRVQLRILAELSSLYPSEVRAIYFNKMTRTHVVFDSQAVFGPLGTEFRPNEVLRSLGIRRPTLLPDKYQIKNHLRPYEHQKIRRALHKIRLYALGLLAPSRLHARGFEPWRKKDANWVTVSTSPLELKPDDTLALLGSFWDFDEVISLANRHRHQGGKVAVLVHDVIPATAPQYCSTGQVRQFWPRFSEVYKYANRFIAISQHTADDFKRCMGDRIVGIPVNVVPLAHEFGFERQSRQPLTEAQPGRPYVLCIGTIESRKNGATLLKAWEKIIDRLGPATPDIVFCGKYGLGADAFRKHLTTNKKLADYVRVEASPSDESLKKMIQESMFTVFPSFYEGWGLPVGEAAWLGKFCLASSASSVPEVLGDLAEYVDPHDENAWANRIINLVQAPEIIEQRENRIRNSKLRSWQDAARSMLEEISR